MLYLLRAVVCHFAYLPFSESLRCYDDVGLKASLVAFESEGLHQLFLSACKLCVQWRFERTSFEAGLVK